MNHASLHNHLPALPKLFTVSQNPGFPTFSAWNVLSSFARATGSYLACKAQQNGLSFREAVPANAIPPSFVRPP